MKTVKLIIIAFAVLFGSKLDAQELKIGYVNVEYILSVWPAVKALESELATYEEQLSKDIQVKQQELQAKFDEYQRTKEILTEPKRQALEVEIQSLQSQIQLYQKNAQIELLKKQQEKLTPLYDTVSAKITEVAKEQNYTHVFNSTISGNSILLYAKDETNNITIAILEKLGVEVPEEIKPKQ